MPVLPAIWNPKKPLDSDTFDITGAGMALTLTVKLRVAERLGVALFCTLIVITFVVFASAFPVCHENNPVTGSMLAPGGALTKLNVSGSGGWFGSLATLCTCTGIPGFTVRLEIIANEMAAATEPDRLGPNAKFEATWLAGITPPQTRTVLMYPEKYWPGVP